VNSTTNTTSAPPGWTTFDEIERTERLPADFAQSWLRSRGLPIEHEGRPCVRNGDAMQLAHWVRTARQRALVELGAAMRAAMAHERAAAAAAGLAEMGDPDAAERVRAEVLAQLTTNN